MCVNSRHGFAWLGRRGTLYADGEVKCADLRCRMEASGRGQRICTHSGFKRVVGHSCRAFCILLSVARTARLSPSGGMADTEVSKTSGGNLVRVRPSPRAPRIRSAPRIARPPFIVAPMSNQARRKPALVRTRRKPLSNGVRAHPPQAGACPHPAPRRAQRKQALDRARRKQPPDRTRRSAATDVDWSHPPAANPPIAGRGCDRAPSSSWCRHRGREADASSAGSRPPHGAGSRAWRSYRRREDPSCPRYRQRWCHR